MSSVSSVSSVKVVVFESLDVKVQTCITAAIKCTLPNKNGYRHFLIFQFCRWLKAIPDFELCEPRQLKPLVKMWHEQALPTIGTKTFDDTWADFCHGWPRVKYPKGSGSLKIAAITALDQQSHVTAEQEYESDEAKLLIRLCFELQRLQGEQPFWLSCHNAAGVLGVSPPTANKMLEMLVADGVIMMVKNNTATKARRYKFIADRKIF